MTTLKPEVREIGTADDAAWHAAEAAASAHAGPAPGSGPATPPPPEIATRLVVFRSGDPVARAALMTAADLVGAPGITGMIGWYAAADEEAGVAALREGARRLVESGADRVLGPMDGSTWARYRLALPPRDGSAPPPPFLTEPVNPWTYPSHFEAAGFVEAELYLSRLVPELDALEDRTREVADRLAGEGVRIEPLDPGEFDAALDELHDLSLAGFAGNPFYAPIDRAAFRAMYEPVRRFLDPELVLLARRGDELVGFIFAFPDLLDPGAAAAGRPTRAIAKSMAVLPDARGSGLGSLLIHELHRRAAARGFTAVIHALMHVDNHSHRISRHGGDVLREYALYAWAG